MGVHTNGGSLGILSNLQVTRRVGIFGPGRVFTWGARRAPELASPATEVTRKYLRVVEIKEQREISR